MVIGILAASLLGLAAHPIHASSALLELHSGAGAARITLRAYADDFPPGNDPTAARTYLATHFRVWSAGGELLPLSTPTVSVEGPMVVLQFEVEAADGLRGMLIWHGVLFERFSDQVNLIQIRSDGRVSILLFTPGDRSKPVP